MSSDPPTTTERSPAKDAATMTVSGLLFAEQARAGGWGRFDFSFGSIALLDPVIASAGHKAELIKQRVAPAAMYLGEVVLDYCGGIRGTGNDLTVILPPAEARPGATPLDCTQITCERLFDTAPVTERVRPVLRTWFGDDYAPADPIDPARLPEMARRRAQAFVHAACAFGIEAFDHSPQSIELVDRYVDERPLRGNAPGRQVIATTAGCYVGEALVAATGAHWILTPERQLAVELRGTAFPLDKVAKRIQQGPRHSVAHFYREVSSFWLSGETEPPATWRPVQPSKRGPFGLRRR